MFQVCRQASLPSTFPFRGPNAADAPPRRRLAYSASIAVACLLLTACGPSKEQVARQAEQHRIDCLDQLCEGDKPPSYDWTKEDALKLNNEWYVGPKAYFSHGSNGADLHWKPDSSTASSREDEPLIKTRAEIAERMRLTIEIFLTGRQRWPMPDVKEPWLQDRFAEIWADRMKGGLIMEQSEPKPGLRVIRFKKPTGEYDDRFYYIATDQRRIRGPGLPVLACLGSAPPHADDFCTGGEYWQPDVYARFRMNASIGPDWPEIHKEVVRVLSLARKVDQ